MKFSPKTIDLLKNFSSINPGIYFTKGSTLRTMSPQKNILCEAVVEDEFPQDFGIHDLNNFLSVLTMNKDPEIEFTDKNAIIKFLGGRSKTEYRFTDKSMIVVPPEKNIALPSIDVEFSLTEDDLTWIQKTASVLRSPNIAVSGNGDTVSIMSFDIADNSAATNSLDIGIKTSKTFKLIFKTENLKVVPGAYDVEISSKGVSHFTNSKASIQYWIATEAGSTYGN